MPIEVTNNQPTKETTEPVNADPVVEVVAEKTPAAEETQAETIEASGTPNETTTQPEEKGKPSKGVQKRFDELTKQREDAKREREDERREKEFWKAEALKAKAPAEKTPTDPNPAPVAAAGEPDPEKFASHAEYLKALTKFEIQEDKRADEARAEDLRQKDRVAKAGEKIKTSVTSFKESHADFDQVVTDAFQVPPALGRAILESEDPAQLMYELCKNKEVYDKIVALPENQLIRELGRFEAKFEAPAVTAASEEKIDKPTSKAPPPIDPVGNKGTGAGKKSISDPNLSQKEFEAIVREQAKGRTASW